MFFRRQRPKSVTFEEKLERLRRAGCEIRVESGQTRTVTRSGCAATIDETGVRDAGVLLGGEIAAIVDVGYQKFLVTPSGRRCPALASHLKELHGFQEDLREALGAVSLYNESLGTVNDSHHYDRVQGR